MIKKLKYLFILLFAFILFPKDTYAISATGTYVLYEALGNYNVQPAYDPNYGNNHNISANFPSNWQLINGVSNDYYTFVKQIYILLDSDSQFNANTRYKVSLTTEFGSYITWTNYYGWSLTSNRTTHNCTDESTNSLNVCNITWNPTNDTSSSTMELVLESSTDTDKISVYIGSIGQASDFVFWNRLGQAQGFKISAISIEAIGGGGSSTDLTEVNEKLDSIGDDLIDINDNISDTNDKLDDINDTLTDDSSVSTNDLEDFFDDIPVISSGPISDILLLPTYILNSIINNVNTQTCQNISIPWFYNQRINFPCWNLDTYIDEEYWGWIELVLYVFMFYNIAMLVVSCWETWTNLSTDFDSMYQPKHANLEYKPKHGGGN